MKVWVALAVVLVCSLLLLPAAGVYYKASWGEGCARCHEIGDFYDDWRVSTHRNINCVTCHESELATNVRHIQVHASGGVPEQIHIKYKDSVELVEKCRSCHQQEYAQWKSGAHSTDFKRIFTDAKHNEKRPLMDDCLRCHGMHVEGGIRDVVTPVSGKGPWQLKDAAMSSHPAIPCVSCHAMHRAGAPLTKPRPKERFRPSLAFFDRRSREAIPVNELPLPAMLDGERKVHMSPDIRQALCYQCHAAEASAQVRSGDDRTPVGVHEGLSCLACHDKHGQDARASCASCHPRLSNCGRDVEKMDTTFVSDKSKHNIHFVKCLDCHPKGVPPRKPRT